jgi:hypothetical protein
MIFPLPDWVLETPEGPARDKAVDRFHLQLACIYSSKNGSIRMLAEQLGVNYHTLRSQMGDCKAHLVPTETYLRIWKRLGPSFVPATVRANLTR